MFKGEEGRKNKQGILVIQPVNVAGRGRQEGQGRNIGYTTSQCWRERKAGRTSKEYWLPNPLMLKGDRKTGRTNNEYWSPNLLMMKEEETGRTSEEYWLLNLLLLKGKEDRKNKQGILVTQPVNNEGIG